MPGYLHVVIVSRNSFYKKLDLSMDFQFCVTLLMVMDVIREMLCVQKCNGKEISFWNVRSFSCDIMFTLALLQEKMHRLENLSIIIKMVKTSVICFLYNFLLSVGRCKEAWRKTLCGVKERFSIFYQLSGNCLVRLKSQWRGIRMHAGSPATWEEFHKWINDKYQQV